MSKIISQTKVLLKNVGKINPKKIEDYLKNDGYKGLRKAFAIGPEKIIAEIKQSELLGRGGAAFPTGIKWELVYQEENYPKYVIANAEEGEPGTFKDKVLLEKDPHSVIEGLIIAGFVINAERGFIYLKEEYLSAYKILQKVLIQAEKKNFLGKNILGSNFSFNIEIRISAGAYITGEETALFNALEGLRPIPRIKPPYPNKFGLFGKPTVINNVETLAYIPRIILYGSNWFKKFGVLGSCGTKLVCLSGDVKKVGVSEIEFGKYTVREIIYGLGRGIKKNKKIKAVIPGGASTQFLTEKETKIKYDFDSLKRVGSSLGTGGIIVFSTDKNIPRVVRDFFAFYSDESCGYCIPCRIGTQRVYEILTRVANGETRKDNYENLYLLGELMKDTARCGLGQACVNPLLSSLEKFKTEYLSKKIKQDG